MYASIPIGGMARVLGSASLPRRGVDGRAMHRVDGRSVMARQGIRKRRQGVHGTRLAAAAPVPIRPLPPAGAGRDGPSRRFRAAARVDRRGRTQAAGLRTAGGGREQQTLRKRSGNRGQGSRPRRRRSAVAGRPRRARAAAAVAAAGTPTYSPHVRAGGQRHSKCLARTGRHLASAGDTGGRLSLSAGAWRGHARCGRPAAAPAPHGPPFCPWRQ